MVPDAIPNNSSGFREFKVYDQARASPDWTSLVSPSQCAAFFKDLETAVPLSAEGVPVSRITDCTFMLFDRLDQARRFCEARVAGPPLDVWRNLRLRREGQAAITYHRPPRHGAERRTQRNLVAPASDRGDSMLSGRDTIVCVGRESRVGLDFADLFRFQLDFFRPA